jgi:hypothetical protein
MKKSSTLAPHKIEKVERQRLTIRTGCCMPFRQSSY